MSVKIIRRFPDITNPGFNYSKWNRQFKTHNVILNGFYSDIYYPSHWTPLSMKCAFGGSEYYTTPRVKYSVNDSTYLVLNEGTFYDSRINSDSKVESFTINFKKDFASIVMYALSNSTEYLIDNPEQACETSYNLFEQLYKHDENSLMLLNRLKYFINKSAIDHDSINETLHFLLEYIIKAHSKSFITAKSLSPSRHSTKIELYKRLIRAKDYIYSNFQTNIDINLLSEISCLSPHHFLRSFKDAFGATPHRMLTGRRISEAEYLLKHTEKKISEICLLVGFESLSSFGALFKRYKGLSPENFRINQNGIHRGMTQASSVEL